MKNKSLKNYLICMVMLVVCLVLAVPALQVNAAKHTKKAAKSMYSITVNRKQNLVIIYKKGKKGAYSEPVKAMVCSVGIGNRTPKGTFYTTNKYRWRQLFYGVYGQYATRIHGSILFHSVSYSKKDPSSLLYSEYNKLGTAASHGCVRLTVEDAKWIYTHCNSGTPVKIYDGKKKEPLEKPQAMKLLKKDSKHCWDPTDTNPKNPWRKVPPVITVKEEKTLEAGVSKVKEIRQMASAKDYRGRSVKVRLKGDYDLKEIGKYTVTFLAKDSYGNKTQKNVRIYVKDTIAPTVTAKNITITKDDLDSLAEGKLTRKELKRFIVQTVKAKDRGKTLDASYIMVDVDELFEAYQNEEYGKIAVYARAKDIAGNVSDPYLFYVRFKRGMEAIERHRE